MLDCYGGDFAPTEIVKGCVAASKEEQSLSFVMVGKQEEILSLLKQENADLDRFELLDARDVFSNNEAPSLILRGRDDTTLVKGLVSLRKRDDIDAFITAGSTGATLAASMFKVGRIDGVYRPCLMATLPTRNNKLVRVLDIGANMDAKSEYLVQYALMANEFLKASGMENPRIALLNVGQEEEKGNALTHEVYPLLKAEKRINFVGNIEADHVLKGEADAVICDAFAGNVFIKSLEETAYFVSDAFKEAFHKNIFTKIGALLQMKHLKKVKKLFSYANQACSPFLGIKKMVVKMHGKSKADNVKAVIFETKNLVENHLIEHIQNAIQTED